MVKIRPVAPDDTDQLYAISLATGAAGGDAVHLYRDGRMMGHIYSVPYAKLSPETCLVAEDDGGVAGYIVGTLDTRAFEARLQREWWPGLRALYRLPSGDPEGWDADQRRAFMIHYPTLAPTLVVDAFPAHLHMNLLPRIQGRGLGTALLDHWLSDARAAGMRGVHVSVNAGNEAGLRFWKARGFVCLLPPIAPPHPRTIWLGYTM
ncbi:GNAT family N-acetyltransferase [Rhizobium sp. BK376]|uniref:GNAT family N-acetyltransferase n=1 Tax=Rhizobium sp. BK376 TaxID=2512149 RepID=UPI00104C8472|nr:GNAT family N-acetyltransferase [Rhizobium sp. BK376]TCR92809.1 acetyltransferase (GNAT) family protein [Rhizobium sp. BK376]